MITNLPTHPRRSGLRLLGKSRALPALLALAAFAVTTRSLAQTPMFNALVTTSANTGTLFPEHATVGDLNGDGKLDAVLIDGSNALRVMLGHGDGTFAQSNVPMPDVTVANVVGLPSSLLSGLPRPMGCGALQAIDVNGDGRLDVVCVTGAHINFAPHSFISVLINTGNDGSGFPQFATTHFWSQAGALRPVTVGDLNGDSAVDFIVGNAYGGIVVWMNNGSGAFTPGQVAALNPGAGGPSVGQGVIADVNGDGKADYVVSSNQNGGANIFFGNGNGTLQTPAIYLPNQAVSVAVADVNSDGKPDLLMGNGASGSEGLYVYLNNGAGAFGAPTLFAIPGLNGGFNGSGSVAVSDINGDGKLDAVLSNLGNNTIAILLGSGNGNFGTPIAFPANSWPTRVFAGDFTGDGKPDIGVVLRNQRHFGVLTNTTVFAPQLPTQTLTILGGSGSVGGVAANVEYYNPSTGSWQPAYLTGGHLWGFVTGTNSWINYKVNSSSDQGAGPTTNQTLWYLYRVRFTVPADAQDPKMTFSLKADNFAQVAINGVTAGGSTLYINNTSMNNVIEGQANQVNVDAAFSQNVHVGENTITLNIGDYGGLNGFNFRIDLSMKSGQPVEIVPVNPDTTAPVITAPISITKEATGPSGAAVTFVPAPTATDNVDGSVPVTANPASGSLFAIATTTVNLEARDAAGNLAKGSFPVTVQDTTAPVITSVPANQVIEATSAAGAVATFGAATATDAVGPVTFTYSPASGSTFAIGTTTVTVTAKDAYNNTSTSSFSIKVQDTTAPTITSLSTNAPTIWPPNHKMVAVTVSATATDLVGVTSLKIISATSNEPDNGLGDGDTAGDIQITGPLSLNLRAERSGTGNGRVYTITVEARDAAGNATTKTVTVSVPKSQGK